MKNGEKDMGRYRTYKNGIYGSRHKGYYIVKIDGEPKAFEIIDEERNKITDNLKDYNECEWYIDKITASEEELKEMKLLYAKEIFELSGEMMELYNKKSESGLNKKEKERLKMVEKIRWRKSEDRVF